MPTYRLVIKMDGPPDLPYSWELYKGDADYASKKSRETFRTKLLARMAGNTILRRLEYQQGDAIRKGKA
jgi:hypothetical protein